MRLPRATFQLLVMVLVCLNLLLRYPPSGGHEMGSDTSFIHSLADSLSAEGRALWILHPTSYFGLYALSYPSGIPFLASELNLSSGLPIEGTFLVLSFLFGVLGPLGMILVGRTISHDDRFPLILAFAMTVAPFYIKDTTWIGAARGFVVALVPFALFLSLKLIKAREPWYLFALIVLIFLMSVIHRMGVLSFFILVAAMFVIPFHSLTQRLRFALVRYENPFRVASLSLAVTGFLSMFYLQFQFPGLAGIDVRAQYGQGSFFSGDSFGILVLNMAVSFMGKMGLLFPLAIMGIVAYTWKRPKDALDKFVLLAMLVFLPILSMRDYITEFVTPLVAILATFTIFWLVARQKRRLKVIAVATVAVLVIGSMGFAWVMKDYWAKLFFFYDSFS